MASLPVNKEPIEGTYFHFGSELVTPKELQEEYSNDSIQKIAENLNVKPRIIEAILQHEMLV